MLCCAALLTAAYLWRRRRQRRRLLRGSAATAFCHFNSCALCKADALLSIFHRQLLICAKKNFFIVLFIAYIYCTVHFSQRFICSRSAAALFCYAFTYFFRKAPLKYSYSLARVINSLHRFFTRTHAKTHRCGGVEPQRI